MKVGKQLYTICVIVLFLLGCATPSLEHSKNLVVFHTAVADTDTLVLPTKTGNFYISKTDTIYLDSVGMQSEEIQIHEFLHWAFEHLTYSQQTELFARWGTFYILSKHSPE